LNKSHIRQIKLTPMPAVPGSRESKGKVIDFVYVNINLIDSYINMSRAAQSGPSLF
jgi:hypothetical protein